MGNFKRFGALLLIIVISVSLRAQTEHGYNMYGQLLGGSTGFGVGFDSRFKEKGVLGYAAGLGFTNMSWDDNVKHGSYMDVDSKGLSIPLELNAIFGSRASKFEIGIGLTAYLLKRREYHHYESIIPGSDGDSFDTVRGYYTKNVFRPNIVGSISVGYRLQRKSGFFMKAGLTLLLGDLKCSPIDGVFIMPNLCFGYTIPHF